MLANHCAECASTGRLAMRVFQTLSAGNIGQPAAPGSGVPAEAPVALQIDAAEPSEPASSVPLQSVPITRPDVTISPPQAPRSLLEFRTGPPNGCTQTHSAPLKAAYRLRLRPSRRVETEWFGADTRPVRSSPSPSEDDYGRASPRSDWPGSNDQRLAEPSPPALSHVYRRGAEKQIRPLLRRGWGHSSRRSESARGNVSVRKDSK